MTPNVPNPPSELAAQAAIGQTLHEILETLKSISKYLNNIDSSLKYIGGRIH